MAKAGDTFEKLALAIWQDASYATLLAEYNNWPVNEPLDTDKVIKVPQFVALYKDKLGSEEFNEFMAKFIGALEPHVKWKQPPKHHHGFLSMVVETIVLVAAAVIAPHLVGALLPALAGTFTGDILASVAGALIDTVGQETAKGMGLMKHINWADVVTAAVTGGMGTKLSVLDKALGKGIANTIVTQGIESTVIQLDDLALGLSKQFDFRNIFMSMLQAGIDAKVNLTLHLNDPISTELANSVAGIGISEATTGHVDLQALAANMLGDIIGEEVGTGIDSALGRNQAGQSYDRAHRNAKGKTTTPRYRNHVRHETETAMRQRNGGSQSSGSSQRNGRSQYNNGSQYPTANNTHNHGNRPQQPQHRDINHTHPHSLIDELKEMTNIHPKDAYHYWEQHVEDQNHAAPHTTQQVAVNQNQHGASATNAVNAANANSANAANNNGPSIQWANNSDAAQVNNYYSRASAARQPSQMAARRTRAARWNLQSGVKHFLEHHPDAAHWLENHEGIVKTVDEEIKYQANALYGVADVISFGFASEASKLEGTSGMFDVSSRGYQQGALLASVGTLFTPGSLAGMKGLGTILVAGTEKVLGRVGVGAGGLELSSREILIRENRERSAYFHEKYYNWDSTQRRARIDELAFGNRFLREQGVPKEYISQVLQSFEPGQIAIDFADDSTYGLRFYGGGSRDIGPYLNPTFPLGDMRSLNALPPVNQANKIMQWQVSPGSPFLFGRIRANFGKPGGGLQIYVPDFENNLWRPKW